MLRSLLISSTTQVEEPQNLNQTLGHCRFCAQAKQNEDLLDLSTDLVSMRVCEIVINFFKIDFVDFTNEYLPKKSCKFCFETIKKSYNFFCSVKASQSVLSSLYSEKNQAPNVKSVPIKCEIDIEIEAMPFKGGECTISIVKEESDDKVDEQRTGSDSNESDTADESKHTLRPKLSKTFKYHEASNSKDLNQSQNIESSQQNAVIKKEPSKVEDDTESSDYEMIPQYCGLPIYENHAVQENRLVKSNDNSWLSYPWSCKHCKMELYSMDDLRSHGKQLHNRCYAFACADCNSTADVFNIFNSFIEHVRQHRHQLRFYCPYCNVKFGSVADCSNHVISHWSNGQQICEWCGEVFPDRDALKRHKSIYRPVRLSPRVYRLKPRVIGVRMYNGVRVFDDGSIVGSWTEYDWACRECPFKASNVDSLREHSQQLHDKCFTMQCIDCLKVHKNFSKFVAHVTAHRPQLKNYCPYCNMQLDSKNEEQTKEHINIHLSGNTRPCDGCGQMFADEQQRIEHLRAFEPHRIRGTTLTEQDLTCDICQKVFTTIPILKKHKETHSANRKREHTCDECGHQFLTKSTLKAHAQIHDKSKQHYCQICCKTFLSNTYLKNHVKRHAEKKFVCDYCDRKFAAKFILRKHILRHVVSNKKKYHCDLCSRYFSTGNSLKIHMNIHCGARPYQCKDCDKTFTNWGNCNKHMMRIHGTTLAKTKLTEAGRIPLEALDRSQESLSSDVKQWMEDIMKPTRPVKK